jgi:RND family efflux transporter MFP subunit
MKSVETSKTPGDPFKVHSDPADELGFDLPGPAKVSPARLVAIVSCATLFCAAIFFAAWLPKRSAQRELAAGAQAAEGAVLRVQVVTPSVRTSERDLALPASVHALEETLIYPRASGYVRKWNVDIGDKVREGQVLVEIDTPELDQQLDQARAQLVQAEAGLIQATANRTYSNTTLQRYKELAPRGVASQQELDQKRAQSAVDEANVNVAEAAIEAQRANVRRLVQMKSFSRVASPFAGTVNVRTIERGALVSPATAMFKISATDPVRVFVQVPQDVAASVRADSLARVSVREHPGRFFEGRVARTAGALDVGSRTMNTEVRVPNPNNELLAGMYAEVALTLSSSHRVLQVPATAVMNDARGLRVAIVTTEQKLHIVAVTIERDTGATIEIASGIQEGDRVVKLGSAELVEGRPVEIAR